MMNESPCFTRNCKHYRGMNDDSDLEDDERFVCAAYPDGIPDAITDGDDLHLEHRGDEQEPLVFEQTTREELFKILYPE